MVPLGTQEWKDERRQQMLTAWTREVCIKLACDAGFLGARRIGDWSIFADVVPNDFDTVKPFTKEPEARLPAAPCPFPDPNR
jgi:hypothetical protein